MVGMMEDDRPLRESSNNRKRDATSITLFGVSGLSPKTIAPRGQSLHVLLWTTSYRSYLLSHFFFHHCSSLITGRTEAVAPQHERRTGTASADIPASSSVIVASAMIQV
jgi:hypothetical protein